MRRHGSSTKDPAAHETPAASETKETRRPDDVQQPDIGALGLLRWAWRQLTSMRTALFLLLLLAVAAVPGSVWPQRSVDPVRVRTYLQEHTTAGPWMDRLRLFDVYSSPWFAAIYLLLFISLIGCVLPRCRVLWRETRGGPVRAPLRLARLPEHREVEVAATPEHALETARRVLGRQRFRLRPADTSVDATGAPGQATAYVSAEKGFLRELGNLVFHLALIGVLIGVAVGHLWGWKGDVIVPATRTFANSIFSDTQGSFDTLAAGPLVDLEDLPPFIVRVNEVNVAFETGAGGSQFGQPRFFDASVTTQDSPTAAPRNQVMSVNNPLHFGSTSVFLLGNGYAPVITVRDKTGKVVMREPVVFRPQDNNYTSTGAVKVRATSPQLGFEGIFAPTISDQNLRANPVSDFPGPALPGLLLTLWQGELFPDGAPQSVYALDTSKMTQPKTAAGLPVRIALRLGETKAIAGDRGTVTFESLPRFAGLSVRYDPGKELTLACSLLALAGLIASLTIRRRRVFVRVREQDGRTLLMVGGLAKGEDVRLGDAVDRVTESILEELPRHES